MYTNRKNTLKKALKQPGLVILMAVLGAFLTACSSVQTVQKDKETFFITDFYDEPPVTFSSNSIENEAEEVCPLGYNILSKNAGKASEFEYNDFTCAAGASCGYVLEWRIQCEEKPQQETSIFGKT